MDFAEIFNVLLDSCAFYFASVLMGVGLLLCLAVTLSCNDIACFVESS